MSLSHDFTPKKKNSANQITPTFYLYHKFITHYVLLTFGLFRKDAITKRAPRYPYRTRSKSRTMSDLEEVQEQMKADMSALKEQMASMMDAMLGMKQLMESNAANAAAVSSAAEADPTLLATAHHPPPNAVGRGRNTVGYNRNPHLG